VVAESPTRLPFAVRECSGRVKEPSTVGVGAAAAIGGYNAASAAFMSERMVDQNIASWNRLAALLRQLDRLREAA
jgi:hypothetical protein